MPIYVKEALKLIDEIEAEQEEMNNDESSDE